MSSSVAIASSASAGVGVPPRRAVAALALILPWGLTSPQT
jgi:hypothetical protein